MLAANLDRTVSDLVKNLTATRISVTELCLLMTMTHNLFKSVYRNTGTSQLEPTTTTTTTTNLHYATAIHNSQRFPHELSTYTTNFEVKTY